MAETDSPAADLPGVLLLRALLHRVESEPEDVERTLTVVRRVIRLAALEADGDIDVTLDSSNGDAIAVTVSVTGAMARSVATRVGELSIMLEVASRSVRRSHQAKRSADEALQQSLTAETESNAWLRSALELARPNTVRTLVDAGAARLSLRVAGWQRATA